MGRRGERRARERIGVRVSALIMSNGVRALAAVCLMLVLSGCVPRDYGVVLWVNQDFSPLASGTVVRVSRGVDSDNMVKTVDSMGEQYLLQEWQVQRFQSQADLDLFLTDYTPYQHIFAQCEKKALPLRERADRFSDILYRLDEGEIVKVIGRGNERTDEAGLKDYWYQALTSSGVRGWVFGYHLSVIDVQQNAVVTGKETRDNVATFLNTTWRPAYFIEMRQAQSFDLARFDPQFGLFPAPLENAIQINLPDYYFEIAYDVALPESVNTFYFGENRELKITLADNQTVIAEVNDPGGGQEETRSFVFHVFADDIQQIANRVRAEERSAR